MKIVIAHLTRMEKGYCCAAGIEVATRRQVRCVMSEGRLPVEVLARYGGPFDMARVVEIENSEHRPEPPHSEDHVVDPQHVRSIPNAAPDWFWELLSSVAQPSFRAIFGCDLERVGPRSCATREGRGRVSLGCYRPMCRPELHVKEQAAGPQIRMSLLDGEFNVSVSVTDIRLYRPDHTTPDRGLVRSIARKIASGDKVLLSLGLTRAFAGNHWLQVNNIHLKSDPTWPLG